MKRQIFSYLVVAAITLSTAFVSCKKKDDIQVKNTESLNQTILADQTSGSSVTFTTTGAWTSTIKETTSIPTKGQNWISITPDHGNDAGAYTITINLEPNETGANRSAVIILTCGDVEVDIKITQKKNDDGDYEIKLLETFKHDSGYFTFEYDNQNRMNRILDYEKNGALTKTMIFTYNGNDLVKCDYNYDSETHSRVFIRNGNEITALYYASFLPQPDTIKLYLDNNGYPIKLEDISHPYVINFQIQNGNILNEIHNGTESTVFKYDNNKSPRINCQTPKWYTMIFGLSEPHDNLRCTHNNMIEGEGTSGFKVRFEYIYDNEGYPTKSTATYSANEKYTAEYIYKN